MFTQSKQSTQYLPFLQFLQFLSSKDHILHPPPSGPMLMTLSLLLTIGNRSIISLSSITCFNFYTSYHPTSLPQVLNPDSKSPSALLYLTFTLFPVEMSLAINITIPDIYPHYLYSFPPSGSCGKTNIWKNPVLHLLHTCTQASDMTGGKHSARLLSLSLNS